MVMNVLLQTISRFLFFVFKFTFIHYNPPLQPGYGRMQRRSESVPGAGPVPSD